MTPVMMVDSGCPYMGTLRDYEGRFRSNRLRLWRKCNRIFYHIRAETHTRNDTIFALDY